MTSVDTPARVAIYSHDTMGLGHLRRNLLIAQALAADPIGADVLLISGACEAQRFDLPVGVDALTVPAISKEADGSYTSRRLRTSLSSLLDLRGAIVSGALEQFRPDVMIVDNAPLGAGRELERALRALRVEGRARCILGLRDITDAPEAVRREWQRAGYEAAIRDLFDGIWVYGDPHVYDRVVEDDMAPDLAERTSFVGYLDQSCRAHETASADSLQLRSLIPDGAPLTLCLVGGGQDGAALAHAFARVRFARTGVGAILTGPFLDRSVRAELREIASRRDDLIVVDFLSDPRPLVERAERVICMGGYNTIGEVLSFAKRALVVPRIRPRAEQAIRARRMSELGLLDLLEPSAATPRALETWIARDAKGRSGPREWRVVPRVRMDGLATIARSVAGYLQAAPRRPSGELRVVS